MMNGEGIPENIVGAEDSGFISIVQQILERLAHYLIPDEKKLSEDGYFEIMGRMTLQSLFLSIAQACMFDEEAKSIASHLPDGIMKIQIGSEIKIIVKGEKDKYTGELDDCSNPIGILHFKDLQVAMGFIQGKVNFREAIPLGDMDIRGHVLVVATFLGLLAYAGKYLG